MQIVKVKICGITRYDDALKAAELGADLVGFNFFHKSPRYVTLEQAAQMAGRLPAYIHLAGVFVNASFEVIKEAIGHCHLDWVQLHGDESPALCDTLSHEGVKVMKALRIRDEQDIRRAEKFFTDAILLDAYHPEQYGGTGMVFDWNLVQHTGKRVFLAGGITPDNAASAVKLGVYGIDVCSGVESEPGVKDHEKMRRLFENIRHLRV
jgi:phosphoribosylanthranilate isomerase